MPDFLEIRFPTDISRGALGGPMSSTTVLELANGREKRNINWSQDRLTFDVSKGVKTYEQMTELLEFRRVVRGRAYGFRFKDWWDYTMPFWFETPGDLTSNVFPTLFTTDGSTATFQLQKVYTYSGQTFTRTITKPVAGTLHLFNNGVAMTEGSGGSEFQVSTTTGIVTLGATVAATTGRTITGYCEFDVPVRFDSDAFQVEAADYDVFNLQQILVKEIRV